MVWKPSEAKTLAKLDTPLAKTILGIVPMEHLTMML